LTESFIDKNRAQLNEANRAFFCLHNSNRWLQVPAKGRDDRARDVLVLFPSLFILQKGRQLGDTFP
jgi:hypothetical protein